MDVECFQSRSDFGQKMNVEGFRNQADSFQKLLYDVSESQSISAEDECRRFSKLKWCLPKMNVRIKCRMRINILVYSNGKMLAFADVALTNPMHFDTPMTNFIFQF